MANRKDSKGRVLKAGEGQRSDGRYYYRFTSQDGKRHTEYAKDLNELRKREREINADLEAGMVYSDVKFCDYAQKFLELKSNLRASTYENYRSAIKTYSQERFYNMQLRDIRKSDILLYIKRKTEQGYANGTISRKTVLLSEIFELAIDDCIIRINPVRGCGKSIGKKNKREALTDDELQMFLDVLESHDFNETYKNIAIFLLETGCRIGEALGLMWDCVNFDDGTIRIDKQLNQHGQINQPKTNAGIRKIPITDKLYSLLKTMPRNGVFVFQKNGNYIVYENVKLFFRRIQKIGKQAYGDKFPKVTCHVIRHTYCTKLAHDGLSLKAIQLIMGHADVQTTANIYVSESSEDAIKEFRKFYTNFTPIYTNEEWREVAKGEIIENKKDVTNMG